jgi:hypothetical protein
VITPIGSVEGEGAAVVGVGGAVVEVTTVVGGMIEVDGVVAAVEEQAVTNSRNPARRE